MQACLVLFLGLMENQALVRVERSFGEETGNLTKTRY